LREVFSDPGRLPDAVTFTSSSTVKNFLSIWGEAELGAIPADLRAISIGPITSATLRENGWERVAESATQQASALAEVLIREFEN
jgi:uroporphyrinogen-III synthase